MNGLPTRGKATTAVLLAAVALSAAGCGSDDEEAAGTTSAASTDDKPVRVAFFNLSVANTYTAATADGIEEVVEREGGTFKEFDANFKPEDQFAQMQDALTSGDFDAMLVVPLNAVGLNPVLTEAESKGVPVGSISFPLGSDLETLEPQAPGQQVAVLDPAPERGKWLGGLTVKACEGVDPCKVAYLSGAAGLPVEELVQKTIEETVAESPNIEIVAAQPGQYLADPASKAVTNILQGNRDLDVITSIGDQMIVGAELALKSAGLEPGTGEGQIRLVGLGASEIAVKAIQEGRWFGSALSLPHTEGVLAAENIIRAARGELESPVGISASAESGRDPEVTKDTLGDFKAEWAG